MWFLSCYNHPCHGGTARFIGTCNLKITNNSFKAIWSSWMRHLKKISHWIWSKENRNCSRWWLCWGAHFCSEKSIVGYRTDAFRDMWHWSIYHTENYGYDYLCMPQSKQTMSMKETTDGGKRRLCILTAVFVMITWSKRLLECDAIYDVKWYSFHISENSNFRYIEIIVWDEISRLWYRKIPWLSHIVN